MGRGRKCRVFRLDSGFTILYLGKKEGFCSWASPCLILIHPRALVASFITCAANRIALGLRNVEDRDILGAPTIARVS